MKSQKREVDKDIDIGLPLQLGDSSYWSLTSDIDADAQTVFAGLQVAIHPGCMWQHS